MANKTPALQLSSYPVLLKDNTRTTYIPHPCLIFYAVATSLALLQASAGTSVLFNVVAQFNFSYPKVTSIF